APRGATVSTTNWPAPSAPPSFAEWKAACDRLPTNRELKHSLPKGGLLPLRTFGQFAEVLDAFFRVCKTGALADSRAWLGPAPDPGHFFNTDATYFFKPPIPFQPFVQRTLVPPGTEVLIHGDLHGDIHSLVAWLEWLNQKGYLRNFEIARPDVYLVFLGDYTDRGLYGIEVLYTVLRLKVTNPDRVLLLRGNHEDVSLAARYGFIAEGRGKYGPAFDLKHVMRLYDFLPAALYLGCETNVIQCNHGGMEPGFDPRPLLDAPETVQFQLLGRLNQQQFLKEHPAWASGLPHPTRRLMQNALVDFQPLSPTEPWVLGFMWNDFSVVRGEPQFDFDPGRAFVYGESTTKYLLDQFSTRSRRLQAVFRAHQHATVLNSMMRRLKAGHGVYRHWQDNDSLGLMEADVAVLARTIEVSEERRIPPASVWTFNVAPDSVYGDACDFGFDSFGILTTASEFEDWKLRVINLTILK
ncbi:MAG: metallophosphoesterase, partial [Bryobacteraceae bacterium]